MTKKWITILIIFVGVIILAFVFSRIFRPPTPEKVPEELPSSTSRDYLKNPQEISEPRGVEQVIDEEILKPVFSLDGKSVRYFSKKDNRLYGLNLDTLEKSLLSPRTFYNVQDIVWSLEDKVFLSFYNEEKQKPIWYLYSFKTNQLIKLDDSINDPGWVLDNQKIVYIYTSYLKRFSLSFSDPDGSNWQRLMELEKVYRPQLFISPNKEKIAIVSSLCYEACEADFDIRIYDLNAKEFKAYTENVGCLDLKWSPDNSEILYTSSEIEEKTGIPTYLLYLLNLETKKIENLEIESFAWKCIFTQDSEALYCAVPKEGTGKEEEIWVSEDIFWKIDLKTNERTQLTNYDLNLPMDASNLFLSLENKLFFTNTKDSKLYSLTLE